MDKVVLTVGRFRSRKRALAALCLRAAAGVAMAAGLAACSTASDSSFTVFADPGKYLYYSCDQIAAQVKNWSKREEELRLLMEKADQGAGGAVVNLIAYKADYVAATEELKLLDRAAREKNCQTAGSWRSNSAIR